MSLKNRASFALQSKKIRLPIVLLVAFLAVLPMVSALDWDNVKSYDKETKTIIVKNALGLGSTLAEITLLDNTDYCLVNCEANIKLNLLSSDYKNPISNLEFYSVTKKWTQTNINNIILKRTSSYEVDVNDYSESCSQEILKNGSINKQCSKAKTGSHKETRYNYAEYNGEDLTAGIYYFKLKGTKGARENIEWVPTFL